MNLLVWNMKLIILLLFVVIATGDKLSHTYFPPPTNALSAGGGFYIQAPSNGYSSTGHAYNTQEYPATVHIGYGRPSSSAGHHQGYQQHAHQPIYQRPPQQAQHYTHRESYNHHNNNNNHGPSLLKFENVNNGDGNYHFEYLTADGTSRHEEGHINNPGTAQQENVVRGSYSYTGPEGKVYTVTYWADSTGFHASGDHLPTPPPVPEAIQRAQDNRQQSSSNDQYQSGGYYNHGYPNQQYIPPQNYNRRHY